MTPPEDPHLELVRRLGAWVVDVFLVVGKRRTLWATFGVPVGVEP